MKKATLIALCIALCLLSAFSVWLICYTHIVRNEFEKTVVINRNGTADKTFAVKQLTLTPSQSEKDEIYLSCDFDGDYLVSLDFIEKENGGLKNFVTVTITADDEKIYNGTLDRLFSGGEKVQFTSHIYSTKKTKIVICYAMPETVGNEAVNTYALFDTRVRIIKG